MSAAAVADLRERANVKRSAGLHWEASRLETVARGIERSPFPLPATITLLVDLHEEALGLVQNEAGYQGSSYDAAVQRLAAVEASLTELGVL